MNGALISVDKISLVTTTGVPTEETLASITLNRPEIANAFNPAMIAAITAALVQIGEDKNVRLVLIQGAGRHFSAGADLAWMKGAAALSHDENVREAELLTAMFEALSNMKVPTVAVVRGAAFGGAVGLIACCDVTLATETAKFALSEVRVGVVPAIILPYLARKISPGQLRRLALSGRVFSAKDARECDLIQVYCSTDSLDAALDEEIHGLLQASPDAQRRFKQLHAEVEANGRRQGSYTAHAIADARTSASGQAGLQAFLTKSEVEWVRKLPEKTKLIVEPKSQS